jgi:hypothetical protein
MMRRFLVAGGVLALGLIVAIGLMLTGCGVSLMDMSIKSAATSCGVQAEDNSVTWTGVAQDDTETISDIACVLLALDVPDSLITRIDNTRGVDGWQTDVWNGNKATWAYDAMNGLTLIVEPAR